MSQNDDLISRREAINALKNRWKKTRNYEGIGDDIAEECELYLKQVPSAHPEIIRCNACKHWTQTTGDMPGFGLGDCDYHNAKLVNCNGYCYWAERKTNVYNIK